MRESDLALSRRRFIQAGAGIAASVALAPSILEVLDRLAPRRLLVPAPQKWAVVNGWKTTSFTLTDQEVFSLLNEERMPLPVVQAQRAMDESFVPGTRSPFRVSVRRDYKQEIWSLDAIGADAGNPMYVYSESAANPLHGKFARFDAIIPGASAYCDATQKTLIDYSDSAYQSPTIARVLGNLRRGLS